LAIAQWHGQFVQGRMILLLM